MLKGGMLLTFNAFALHGLSGLVCWRRVYSTLLFNCYRLNNSFQYITFLFQTSIVLRDNPVSFFSSEMIGHECPVTFHLFTLPLQFPNIVCIFMFKGLC